MSGPQGLGRRWEGKTGCEFAHLWPSRQASFPPRPPWRASGFGETRTPWLAAMWGDGSSEEGRKLLGQLPTGTSQAGSSRKAHVRVRDE